MIVVLMFLMIVVLMFLMIVVLMIVLMIWQSPRQQKCEVGISLT